ncbi:SA1362 family protein [Bacillus sp. FJAT-45350]|uniref:SA1362 family protein n=1 Tax=Bacillus sp. FJAT-45350 TaxID=2011014 RepID=UPI000BB790A8|nr:SA1362 family protein [Bacillus sp. FJAT-45350]
MSRQFFHPLVMVIIGLAVLGFVYRLVTNPLGLFTQIILYAAIAFGIFLLYKHFISKRMGMQSTSHRPNTNKTKPSNVVPHKRKTNDKKASVRPLKRRPDHNLTVIEGKKSKKKNRALF